MIIDILLPLSLLFIMFNLGLGLTVLDFQNVIREPKAFAVGLINQMVFLPIIAFIVILIFSLTDELAVGMMILACCPGGVTSNILTRLAKGDTALSISYTAVISIITVITLPIIVGISIQYFMTSEAPQINILSLGLTMFLITTIPVCVGLFLNSKYKISHLFKSIAHKVSTILFVIIIIGALASEWDTFKNNVDVLGPAIIMLISMMLLLGFYTSKLLDIKREKSIAIAIETGIQNATVGITIGNLIMPVNQGISVLSLTSGVYGILMYLVCIPFIFIFFRK